MKVGMILDAPFPPDLRVEKEALTLVGQGHEVILFCLSYDRDFYEDGFRTPGRWATIGMKAVF